MQTTTEVKFEDTKNDHQFRRNIVTALFWLILGMGFTVALFKEPNKEISPPNQPLATHACIEYYPELNQHIAHIQCGEITN